MTHKQRSDDVRLPWKDVARSESSRMRLLASALPLADRLTETVKALRSFHMSFRYQDGVIVYSDDKRTGLTELELLELVSLTRSRIKTGFMVTLDMQPHLNLALETPNFHYIRSRPMPIADQLDELNSQMKAYSASLTSQLLEVLAEKRSFMLDNRMYTSQGIRTVTKKSKALFERAAQLKTAACTIAEICELLNSDVCEVLETMFKGEIVRTRRYAELKERLERNGLDECRKQALRSELIRLTFPEALAMMDFQSQMTQRRYIHHIPYFTENEIAPAPLPPIRSPEEDEAMARGMFPGLAAKVDAEIAAERAEARAREIADREIRKAKRTSFRILTREGVPLGYITDCFAQGIISAGAIIDKFLESRSTPFDVVQVKSYRKRKGETAQPKPLTDAHISQLFDKILEDRFGNPPALSTIQTSLLTRGRVQVEAFVREFAEYSLKQAGERGVFAPSGTFSMFKEKRDTTKSSMENWRVFGLQLGGSRIVLATDARTSDIKLVGVYNNHDDYVEELAFFQASAIRSAVRISRSNDGSPEFSISSLS